VPISLLTTFVPIEEAVKTITRRTAVASPMNSAGWGEMERGLRRDAFWSATVEHAKFLSSAQEKLLQSIRGERARLDNGETVNMDQGRFVKDMRSLVQGARSSGELPAGPSATPLQDIGSSTRLRLFYDMQTRMAQGEARWRRQQDPDVLNMWPAQELTRSSAAQPRPDAYWEGRWLQAAQDSGDDAAGTLMDETGRFVALKTSGIWEALSVFRVPWPPFDYGSQRRLRNVARDEAVELGLLQEETTLEPIDQKFDRDLEASTANMSPEAVDGLRQAFGDQIELVGNIVRWVMGGKAA
jgi:hypothetical protein